ncbi:MFS transporter [Aureimonas ureilytica]|uniref:MFS transporter n=1 Tax=Aureimonas ureilytica TaxID=401562 RepID=UPI00036FD63A|nr:MFS transporter [Aureimonas ureilytica]
MSFHMLTRERIARSPDKPRDTNVPLMLLSLALGAFALGTAEFAAMSLLPSIRAGFSVDAPTAAHAVSLYAIGVVVGAPAIAIGFARMSRRMLLVLSIAIFAIGNIGSALAQSFEALLAFRFLSGLPHGAYLGVASLVAASMVSGERRAQAVSYVFLGLTTSVIFGVGVATALGQMFGWYIGFAIPGAIAALTAIMILAFVPKDRPDPSASPLAEINGLKDRRIWLTLATGAIGFAGYFAVFSFTSSILLEVTMVEPFWVPALMTVYGIGMSLGTLVFGWLADRNLKVTLTAMLALNVVALGVFAFVVSSLPGLVMTMLFIGAFSALGGVLQTRLMEVARNAQTSAAVLNHSAMNFANALGPWLAGLSISLGYGLPSAGLVAAGLSIGGLAIWLYGCWDDAGSLRKDAGVL